MLHLVRSGQRHVSSSREQYPSSTAQTHSNSSSVPAKKPTDPSKPAPTAEEVAEWKEGLEECIAEVKKLDTGVQTY